MKAKITIEQFDNGISLRWESPGHDDTSVVAVEGGEIEALGKMVMGDIEYVMNREACNSVVMEIEYKTE